MFTLGCVAAGLYLLLLGFKILLSLRYIQKMSRAVNLDSINNNPVGCAKRTSTNVAKADLSDITIMQPILSGDPLLESSLRYNLEHQLVRFVWLVDHDDPEGLRLTQVIAKDFANVKVIGCPSVPQQVNPKLFKLHYGFSQVTTSLVAVLDDDTRLSKGSLEAALKHLRYADIYTGLPYYLHGQNFWSSLLAHFVNDNSALTYLPVLNFRPAFSLNGMFYVLPCQTLKRLGGFAAIWHQLTDDYAMAKLVTQHQGKIVQGISTQAVQTSIQNFNHYMRVMHRWFLFAFLQINEQKGLTKILLLIFLALPSLLFLLSLLGLLTSVRGLIVLAVLVCLRFVMFQGLQKKIISNRPSGSLLMSLLAECLQPLHLLHAILSRKIIWRKRRIQVFQDGTFVYLMDKL